MHEGLVIKCLPSFDMLQFLINDQHAAERGMFQKAQMGACRMDGFKFFDVKKRDR